MISVPFYRFTPCCGGHPVSLKITDELSNVVNFDNLPKVYQYNGTLPYYDNLGNVLLPGNCYLVSSELGDPTVVPGFYDCPQEILWSETTHNTCGEASTDPKCACTEVFEFVSCCTGESSYYIVTNNEGTIVSGTTYTVAFDLNDLTTAGCYTINAASVEDVNLLPTIDITNIGSTVTCGDSICEVLCLPCICNIFSGTSGTYSVITCDLKFGVITGTPSGPVIIYDGDPTEYPITSICLRYWQEQVGGLTRTESGDCDIVYWNQTGSEINCPTNYKIVDCSSLEEICVSNDLSAEFALGQAITLLGQPDRCWRIEETEPCEQTVTITYTITHEDCGDCLNKLATNYQLINCNDFNTFVYTSTDLSGYEESIITLQEYPDDCFYVQVLTSDIPSDIPVTPTGIQFATCEDCLQPQYLLEDCNIDNPEPNIITNTDLSAFVGQVVTLINCPDICWTVSETDSISTPQSVHVTNDFESCELCVQPTPPPAPPVYKYKSITPGYNTPGCTPDKFERALCNFSEAMYRQVMVDAYGITPCCGEDDIKFEIKYELIKLKAITDPDYNCLPSTTCECSTSVSGLSQNCPTD